MHSVSFEEYCHNLKYSIEVECIEYFIKNFSSDGIMVRKRTEHSRKMPPKINALSIKTGIAPSVIVLSNIQSSQKFAKIMGWYF
jgi:hypothetical protein